MATYKTHVISTKDEYLTSGYRIPSRPDHTGVDFVSSARTEKKSHVGILCFADGEVVTTGKGVSVGNWVDIKHDGKYLTRYHHMKDNSIKVKAGQKVNKGDVIGIMGTTGDSTGIHLHFAIKENSTSYTTGEYVDPMPYLYGEKEFKKTITPIQPTIFKVGDKVRVKQGAKTYTGANLASFVYTTVYDLQQISGDRIVIGLKGVVTAAVNIKDLYK